MNSCAQLLNTKPRSAKQRQESVATVRFRVGQLQGFHNFSTAMAADFMVDQICIDIKWSS